jgi:hypothetical protein
MAVSYYLSPLGQGNSYQTQVEEWANGAWSIIPSADTSPDEYNVLGAVSCVSKSWLLL